MNFLEGGIFVPKYIVDETKINDMHPAINGINFLLFIFYTCKEIKFDKLSIKKDLI